ncbi:3-hydroxyacyl-CoA dehydrogenase family protein [Phaeobacter sp. J2-8]|uniref:3-hydroxyacyl-CoA dehydrogenase family protein n=1 Tax=Phaeobacter sp. J2-8 TaxID=2931394 RepID=UPI001FD2D4F3|nr:3-hydroxyacyl-CoA dehydrogenase family protein [Phaeobacter sp. J2-8]MCJ7872749.1 3-hydroxyacyl-CoA dehydrogenase family protein [Phaeobacter sp. J2-8]
MSPTFENICIIGAGVMGHGIAVVHALGGSKVVLCDLSDEALEKAKSQIAGAFETLCEGQVATAADVARAQALITYSTDLDTALATTDYVVEAITEDLEVKRRIFSRIEALAPKDAVVTSNTSYLDIFPALPEGLRARAFVVHWYTPPYIIDLVDVVPAPEVPVALADKLMSYLTALGKKPVRLKKFIPGYIANRVQMAIESEIFHLLDAGIADAADIDESIREGLAMRLALFGQFKKIDYTGVKIVRDSHKLGAYVPPVLPTGSQALDKMVEDGHEGVSHGRGFYDYAGQSPIELFHERDMNLMAVKRALKPLKT